MDIGEGISGAYFSKDRRFRFALWRKWDNRGPALLFIGLNPSTAAEYKDDPTIYRVVGFAKKWGYGGIYCGNLFGFVTRNPMRLLMQMPEEAKNENDAAIAAMRKLSKDVLVGWGFHGSKSGDRPVDVLALVGKPVYCLKVIVNGEPAHPLYLNSELTMIEYERRPA